MDTVRPEIQGLCPENSWLTFQLARPEFKSGSATCSPRDIFPLPFTRFIRLYNGEK